MPFTEKENPLISMYFFKNIIKIIYIFIKSDINTKNQINQTQLKKKNISQMEEAIWKEQIMKKDNSYMKKNQGYKQNEFENPGEESFSMNEMQNASMSLVNSD